MWTARLNLCGQYWGARCSRRFFSQRPYGHAYTRLEGERTTLRMFVYFQEDSVNSVGAQRARALVYKSTRDTTCCY